MASCVCDDWPIEKRVRKPHQSFLEHRAVAEELDELLGTASREAGHSRIPAHWRLYQSFVAGELTIGSDLPYEPQFSYFCCQNPE